MLGGLSRIFCRVGAAAVFAMIMATAGQAQVEPRGDDAIHLGVASCRGSNCHSAAERSEGSSVPQNEYLIWSKSDKHHRAYNVLREEGGLRIARNLGLPDAATAEMCLGCHTDPAPPARRGPLFQISDGVGCEACHGGASTWLGVHISGARHSENLAAGLYPTEQPAARATRCLSCHFGDPADDNKFVTHRIMGAGHPRMGFELDTYTAVEPAHFVVDQRYIERKGSANDVQVWAIGQAVELAKRMGALIEPKRAPKGIFPELVLFDCQSCHHPYNSWRGERDTTGLAPGSLKLYDANAAMLRVIAARLAPAASKALSLRVLTLQHASTESWATVQGQAHEIRRLAIALLPTISSHDFTPDDLKGLAGRIIALGLTGDEMQYSEAEQTTMALASILSTAKFFGNLNYNQIAAMSKAISGLYGAFASGESYRQEPFVRALREFRRTMPQ
jgi:hypothetical protein